MVIDQMEFYRAMREHFGSGGPLHVIDELFETISQCLLASVDRDALSGWGAVVHVITPQGITSKSLKGRMD